MICNLAINQCSGYSQKQPITQLTNLKLVPVFLKYQTKYQIKY